MQASPIQDLKALEVVLFGRKLRVSANEEWMVIAAFQAQTKDWPEPTPRALWGLATQISIVQHLVLS